MKQAWQKVWRAIGLALCVLLLAACGKPDYMSNPRPILHTTISSDGQMIATLLNAGTDEQRLRVMRLDKNEGWQDIKAPRFTQTIQFGLTGKQLLLTHALPDIKKNKLVMMDLDNLGAALVEIYSADELGFPRQVSSDEFIVRRCVRRKTDKGELDCKNIFGFQWVLIAKDKEPVEIGSGEISARYSFPVVVNQGVFWIAHQLGISDQPHPKIFATALPGGKMPNFQRERLEKNTTTMSCDSTANRCLRRFISNFNQKDGMPYVYDVDVLFGLNRCNLAGVAGSSNGVSITPDGSAAVMSLSTNQEQLKHVVVFSFAPDKCAAISTRHINF